MIQTSANQRIKTVLAGTAISVVFSLIFHQVLFTVFVFIVLGGYEFLTWTIINYLNEKDETNH